MKDLIEHWDLIMVFLGVLLSVVFLLFRVVIWFLKRLLNGIIDSFKESITRLERSQQTLCEKLDTVVEEMAKSQIEFTKLKTEHDLKMGSAHRRD